EWGQLLYVTNGWLSYSLFKADYKNGDTLRSFYDVPKNHPKYEETLYRLSVHNDYDALKEFNVINRVNDNFRQTSADISLFGLYSSSSRNRFDEIDEYEVSEN